MKKQIYLVFSVLLLMSVACILENLISLQRFEGFGQCVPVEKTLERSNPVEFADWATLSVGRGSGIAGY